LPQDLYNRGVDDRSVFGKNSLGFQCCAESLEEFALQPLLGQSLPRPPETGVVGDCLSNVKPQKASEGKSVGDLILELLVTEIEKALKDQGVERSRP
jgi:hypothetical protein